MSGLACGLQGVGLEGFTLGIDGFKAQGFRVGLLKGSWDLVSKLITRF